MSEPTLVEQLRDIEDAEQSRVVRAVLREAATTIQRQQAVIEAAREYFDSLRPSHTGRIGSVIAEDAVRLALDRLDDPR